MNNCQPKILISQDGFCIAQCQHCLRVGLTFRNLLIGFEQADFLDLCQTVGQVNFDESCTVFPGGQLHLVINTGHPDIQFMLSRPEFTTFSKGLSQASRWIELQQLLKIQSN